MASADDEACSSTEKMEVDTPTECETVQSINAQFPKIDNLEYFPEKVLFHIFSKVNDNDLLHLSDTSCRFEKIARIVFKDKYADKFFVLVDDSKQELYEELFSRFGRSADIKAIEVINIWNITEHHWLPQLLRQYTNYLRKLTFHGCSFEGIEEIMSDHMNVEHLVLRSVRSSSEFILPNYRHLKQLEMNDVDNYNFTNLAQTIRNNPELESLKLWHFPGFFTFHDAMMMIAQNSMHLQLLTELHLSFDVDDSPISANDMSSIIDALKNLQSLKLTLTDSEFELIQRLGLACKHLKHLSLECYDGNFSDAMFDALGQFTTVDKFELNQDRYNERIETVVGQMANLRHLDLRMLKIPDSSTFILSLLRNCPSIETITIHTGMPSIKPQFFVSAQFWNEFNEVMQQPTGKVELKMFNYSVMFYVTKKEIVWHNTVMHWHEWNCNETNVKLLDLATPSAASVGAEAEQKKPTPFDHILGYLDLASLYSMSAASENSKRLVDNYVKRHAQRKGTFIISDQFHHYAEEELNSFAEHVENLKLDIFDEVLIYDVDAVAEQYTKLNKLSIYSKWSVYSTDESLYIFPQVRHLIVDAYRSHLCSILQYYPKLETLHIKSDDFLHDCCLEPLEQCGIKKFIFEYGNESKVQKVRKIFGKTSTELIPIHN